MRILPFLILTYKVPVRIGKGTLRIGIGFLIRLGPKGWTILIATVAACLLLGFGLPLLMGALSPIF